MDFVVVGLNHKTAPVEIREQAFIPPTAVAACVQRLIDRELVESGVLLSTCNRTELFAMASRPLAADRLIEAFGDWPHQLPFESWQRYAFRTAGRAAMEHLFRVAAGLESMVLGEDQVLGQLKTAVSAAREGSATDARLEIVMRGAIRAGKRVRRETLARRTAVSVSHIAVWKAADILGNLGDRGVLLLGAGPMSGIALRLLRRQGVGSVFIASRTIERAEQATAPGVGQAIAMDRLNEIADQVDLILSASSAPHYLIDVPRIEDMQRRRAGRPLLLMDMAVPRDIDPLVRTIPGIRLLDIDDLQPTAESTQAPGAAWISAAEAIIAEELTATEDALEARDGADVIAALIQQATRVRDDLIERYIARLPDAAGQRALRELAHSLTARLLHQPIQALRHTDDERIRSAIGQAFGIGADDARQH